MTIFAFRSRAVPVVVPQPADTTLDAVIEGLLFQGADGWYYRLALSGARPEADSDPIGPFRSEGEALADLQARQMWTE